VDEEEMLGCEGARCRSREEREGEELGGRRR